MIVLAIDPGPTESAYVKYVVSSRQVLEFGKVPSRDLLPMLERYPHKWDAHLAVEMIASYGMPVGAEVFETCVWIGRYVQAWSGGVLSTAQHTLVYRREVKLHLCASPKAKDGNVRAALIDRYGGVAATKKGGALYKISKDVWAALGVAVTFADGAATAHDAKTAAALQPVGESADATLSL